MRVVAFVGASGTGKSFRAITIAKQNGIEAIIDDGLLIAENTVIAGISAKSEPTRIASIRRAIFTDASHRAAVKSAIEKHEISSIMILGTSVAMTERIASALDLPEISKTIFIEDVATPEEIALALEVRSTQGQHVIPVPTFRIKKYFSGYFLHPLRFFQKNLSEKTIYDEDEKSIVRPTFSYMGQYTISDSVLIKMAIHEASKVEHVVKVLRINTRTTPHGAHIDMTVAVDFGIPIPPICRKIQKQVSENLQEYTSINIGKVNILVKTVVKNP